MRPRGLWLPLAPQAVAAGPPAVPPAGPQPPQGLPRPLGHPAASFNEPQATTNNPPNSNLCFLIAYATRICSSIFAEWTDDLNSLHRSLTGYLFYSPQTRNNAKLACAEWFITSLLPPPGIPFFPPLPYLYPNPQPIPTITPRNPPFNLPGEDHPTVWPQGLWSPSPTRSYFIGVPTSLVGPLCL